MKSNIILILFALSVLSGCKKDDDCYDPTNPECRNYDPCHNALEVNADFRILEIIGSRSFSGDTIMIETDTVFILNLVQFLPKQDHYDSVKWLIGAETLNEHVVSRKNFPVYQTIPITLIVYRKPNLTCFPNDDGRDTVTKMITAMPLEDLPINGKYQGSNTDSPNNQFTITINDTMFCPQNIGRNLLKNIPNGIPREGPYTCSFPFPPAYGGKTIIISKENHADDSYDNHGSNYCGMSIRATLKGNGELTAIYEYDEIGLKNAIEGYRHRVKSGASGGINH